MIHQLTNDTISLSGMASVHSHAFQRAMRGRTQRKQLNAGSFWSWRGLMYQLVEQIDPDSMYAIAKLAYTEMALSGITLVGEFHYLHHSKDGTPYPHRTELADAVIRAATDVGIRICLIRTAYMRGGHQKELTPAQHRFSDPSIDLVLQDVETLQKQHANNPLVNIALAAHSIRAVPIQQITVLNDYATKNNLPFHMHVCEQRRELIESVAEHGVTPIQLLADHGVINGRFVGVHATHLNPAEINLLGQANAFVNLCRTTERDLGDGLPQVQELVTAGARLCVGIDSHCGENGFEEIRAVENDERSRLEARTTVGNADFLYQMGSSEGYAAVGLGQAELSQDKIELNRHHIAIAGLPNDQLLDGVVFNGTPDMVRNVTVNGRQIVEDGRVQNQEQTIQNYIKTIQAML